MTNIIIHGCNGRMGQFITSMAADDPDVTVVAGVDAFTGRTNPYPVFSSIKECNVKADVIVDFSNASAVDDLMDHCEANSTPVVMCTTGLSEAQLERVKVLSTKVAVLRSANMSMGVNTLLNLVKTAAGILADAGFDIEIVEKHHSQKLDAPSGTAIALADAINEALDNKYNYIYDRSGRRAKRDKSEIGISAVRGGTIVGEHEIIFAGTDEVIEFKHTAYSRQVFARGALQAAKFLSKQTSGLFNMQDVISAAENE